MPTKVHSNLYFISGVSKLFCGASDIISFKHKTPFFADEPGGQRSAGAPPLSYKRSLSLHVPATVCNERRC